MVGGFLAQMWDLFDKFVGGLRTVAVSFEERPSLEFPSFAFCDSRAFRNITLAGHNFGNEVFFNATTFDLDEDVKIGESWGTKFNYTFHIVPTNMNGYCKLFDIHGNYEPTNTYIGKVTTHNDGNIVDS